MMTKTIVPRKSNQRGHVKTDWLDTYHTFSFGEYIDPKNTHFGALRVINEDRVSPATGFPMHSHQDMEVVTIVLSGELEHKDDLGNGSVIRPRDVQRMTAGTGIRHSEFNPSDDNPVHLYQIWLFPEEKGLAPGYEEKRFDLEATKNQWQLIGSQDGRDGSITIHQDVHLYQTQLEAGQPLTKEFENNRMVWLQVARGEITIDGDTYQSGDGIGIIDSQELTIQASQDSHLILFDLKKARYTLEE